MSLLPNEEQRQLADSARDFLAERSPVAVQRQLRDAHDPLGFKSEIWAAAADMGWTAAVLPEARGGLDFGWQGFAAIFEAMGHTLAALPLLSSIVLGAGLLLEAGSRAQQQAWLPELISGHKRLALALEETGRHAPRLVATRVTRQDDGWVLDGEKQFVIDGVGATAFAVAATGTDDAAALQLFVVVADAPGVEVTPLCMVDSRNSARVGFRAVKLTADAHLGAIADCGEALERVLDHGRICLAAEALGLLREVFTRTISYLNERSQFGVKIGSFQALQHRAARLYCDLELLESCVRAGCEAIDVQSPQLAQLASLAKARAADLCVRLIDEAIQLHGGIGVTDEFDLGLFAKRARVLQQLLGDAAFHRERYARLRNF
ncbi:MAG TPA: acyl-CoA dehydrogenase [Nevskiaceae bacterium]|nr:acyl-CoA dehydrogenase [Nevskiaceae bacterium]